MTASIEGKARASGPEVVTPQPRAHSYKEAPVIAEWQHQLRIYLAEEVAGLARTEFGGSALEPLAKVLSAHRATLVSQLDAFESYLAEAEKNGPDAYPLYKWTKETVEHPAKRRKHMLAFALRVGGQEVYSKETADTLERALQPFVDGVLVTRVSRHDTNPANNLPIPAEYRS